MYFQITTVALLLGLLGIFHYTDFVPVSYELEHYDGYVRERVRQFERYLRCKGWFGFVPDITAAEAEAEAVGITIQDCEGDEKEVLWRGGERRCKVQILSSRSSSPMS